MQKPSAILGVKILDTKTKYQSYPGNELYHGILHLVDKSGINLTSPVPDRFVPSAGPSKAEVIPIHANVKPTPYFVTISLKRFTGTT